MNLTAILMMLLAILLVWGGLLAAILYLRSHPSPYSDEVEGGGDRVPDGHGA